PQLEVGKEVGKQIAILAGSRKQEIKDNLRMMLECASQFEGYKLVIAGAPNFDEAYYRKYIPKGIEAEIRFGQTYQLLRESVAALVTSGTATLETAILRVPQVVCYGTTFPKFFTWLRGVLIKVKYVSLVNLIVDREIVKELIASDMTKESVTRCLRDILPGGSAREQMLKDYEEMNRLLGGAGASKRAATEMIEALQ
ncbi:MAG: lipid-A-disaccharide synthase, partial [Bacteroidaceae bacterium]|nr:lipid-A-disaccharide synthase [Bacteroidaceae bacterium]